MLMYPMADTWAPPPNPSSDFSCHPAHMPRVVAALREKERAQLTESGLRGDRPPFNLRVEHLSGGSMGLSGPSSLGLLRSGAVPGRHTSGPQPAVPCKVMGSIIQGVGTGCSLSRNPL